MSESPGGGNVQLFVHGATDEDADLEKSRIEEGDQEEASRSPARVTSEE